MKKLIYHPITITLATLTALAFIFSLRSSLKRTQISRNNIKELKQLVDSAQTELESKEQQLEQAKQPLAKEKIMRNELLMKKPGEFVLQIKEPQKIEEKEQETKNSSPWEEWKKLLLN